MTQIKNEQPKQKINLSIEINASKEKIWNVLLDDKTYRIWTSVFHPGSYAESDWKEGSKVLFKTPEGKGLVSKVVIHKPMEIISFEHLGVVKDNMEIFDDEEFSSWQGMHETYTVKASRDKTELFIEQDITEDYKDWFYSTWEKALQKIKELSENNV